MTCEPIVSDPRRTREQATPTTVPRRMPRLAREPAERGGPTPTVRSECARTLPRSRETRRNATVATDRSWGSGDDAVSRLGRTPPVSASTESMTQTTSDERAPGPARAAHGPPGGPRRPRRAGRAPGPPPRPGRRPGPHDAQRRPRPEGLRGGERGGRAPSGRGPRAHPRRAGRPAAACPRAAGRHRQPARRVRRPRPTHGRPPRGLRRVARAGRRADQRGRGGPPVARRPPHRRRDRPRQPGARRGAARRRRPDDRRRRPPARATSRPPSSTRRRCAASSRSARMRCGDAEEAHADADDHLRGIEQTMAARAATRDHVLLRAGRARRPGRSADARQRPVREALAAFDDDTRDRRARPGRPRAGPRVDRGRRRARAHRVGTARPSVGRRAGRRRAPSRPDRADHRRARVGRPPRRSSGPDARDEIEAAHEAVLEAEEDVDQSGGHEDDLARLHQAREVEHAVLRRHGYETYLDVILAAPRPEGDAQADLLDALRARRVAEDTLAVAAGRRPTRPPSWPRCAVAARPHLPRGRRPARLRPRRQRGRAALRPPRRAAHPHPRRWPPCSPATRSSRSASPCARRPCRWLVEQDQDIGVPRRVPARHRPPRPRPRLPRRRRRAGPARRPTGPARHVSGSPRRRRRRRCTASACSRTSWPTGRPTTSAGSQRIAAAEQLRAQIAAVSEALDRSEDEYTPSLGRRRVRRHRRRGQRRAGHRRAVRRRAPPAPHLRGPAARRCAPGPATTRSASCPGCARRWPPRSSGPRWRWPAPPTTSSGPGATSTTRRRELDDHLTVVPTDDVERRRPPAGRQPTSWARATPPPCSTIPFVDHDDDRVDLLDQLAAAADRRPVVLLTDDPDTLGWAISLPDDLGAVTRLAADTAPDRPSARRPTDPQDSSGHLISPKDRTVPRRIPIRIKLAAALAMPICALLLVSRARGGAKAPRSSRRDRGADRAGDRVDRPRRPHHHAPERAQLRQRVAARLRGDAAAAGHLVRRGQGGHRRRHRHVPRPRSTAGRRPSRTPSSRCSPTSRTSSAPLRETVDTYTGPRGLRHHPDLRPFFSGYTTLIDELFTANGQVGAGDRRPHAAPRRRAHRPRHPRDRVRGPHDAGAAARRCVRGPAARHRRGDRRGGRPARSVRERPRQVRELGTGRYQAAADKVDEEFAASGYTDLARSAIDTGQVQVADTTGLALPRGRRGLQRLPHRGQRRDQRPGRRAQRQGVRQPAAVPRPRPSWPWWSPSSSPGWCPGRSPGRCGR